MRVVAVALPALLIGCATPPRSDPAPPCAVPCFGAVSLSRSSCAVASESVQRARDLMTAELISPLRFCHAFAGVRIVERRELSWKCREFAHCEGEYDPASRTVHVGAGFRGLMHELLHHYETGVLERPSLNHKDWERGGYFRLIDDYLRTHRSGEPASGSGELPQTAP